MRRNAALLLALIGLLALPLRSAPMAPDLQKRLLELYDRYNKTTQAKEAIPDHIEVLHASAARNGTKATLFTIASKKIPSGAILRRELMIEFINQDGAWKLAQPTFGPDPGKIPSCQSESFYAIGAYEDSSNTSLGGLIMRVAFEPQYTLVIVRVVDENNCAYLPNREELPKLGVDPASLTPYATAEIDGRKHKSDPRKIWGDNIKVHAEE